MIGWILWIWYLGDRIEWYWSDGYQIGIIINTIQWNTNGYEYPLYWMYWNCWCWWWWYLDGLLLGIIVPLRAIIHIIINGFIWDYVEDIGYWDEVDVESVVIHLDCYRICITRIRWIRIRIWIWSLLTISWLFRLIKSRWSWPRLFWLSCLFRL